MSAARRADGGAPAAAAATAPWRDWVEWQQVHAALFSEDPFAQQRGISRVAAWRSRAQLPVAIESTAQLAELRLHEQLAEHHQHAVGVSSRSHMELSLLHASVVVRCVNGLADGAQSGAYASAVSALAQRVGIPLWIVDLRHESTHNRLPSLPVLRFAAQHLRAWLRANYWRRQEAEIRARVRAAAAWLCARAPFAGGAAGDAQSELAPAMALPDADSVRDAVVPLLVSGQQYGERVAPTGLLFLSRAGERAGGEQVAAEECASVLLELQGQWRGFSAWLMACVAKKVFRATYADADVQADVQAGAKDERKDADTDADADADADGPDEREARLALQWIAFLASKAWRDRLAAVAVDEIYACGAEMLVAAERLRAARRREGLTRKQPLDQLIGVLRSVSDVAAHPLLTAEAVVDEALDAAAVAAGGWRALPAWSECPLGLRHVYAAGWAADPELAEYSLDDDSVPPPDGCAFVAAGGEDAEGEHEDEAIDEMLRESDEAYDLALLQVADLHAAVDEERGAQAFSAASVVLPAQELQRIQDEIEIW